MARIRTVKPELFKHDKLFDLENQTGLPIRLAWIGLFTVCDREGRFRWNARRLSADVLPYDIVDFELILDALHASGMIQKYQHQGEEFGVIPSWKRHQVINKRESQSSLPEPNESNLIHPKPIRLISGEIQRHVHARDNGMCRTCGAMENLCFDLIRPITSVNEVNPENVQLLCRGCSLRKGNSRIFANLSLTQINFVQINHENTCTHVHARGEGKGRERKGKEEKNSSYLSSTNETQPFELEAKTIETARAVPELLEVWNSYCEPNFKKAEIRSKVGTRYRACKARWKENPDREYWKQVIETMKTNPFFNGMNDRKYIGDFDFFIKPDSATKVLEGKYSVRQSVASKSKQQAIQEQNEDVFDRFITRATKGGMLCD